MLSFELDHLKILPFLEQYWELIKCIIIPGCEQPWDFHHSCSAEARKKITTWQPDRHIRTGIIPQAAQLCVVLSGLVLQSATVQFNTADLAFQRHMQTQAKTVPARTDLKERERKRWYYWFPFMSTESCEKGAEGLVIVSSPWILLWPGYVGLCSLFDLSFNYFSSKQSNVLIRWKRNMKKLAWNSTFKKLRSWHLVPSLHGKQMGKQWKHERLYFFGLQNHCRWWLQPWN